MGYLELETSSFYRIQNFTGRFKFCLTFKKVWRISYVNVDAGIDLEKDVDSNEGEEQELLKPGSMRKRASPLSSKTSCL